MEFKEYRFYKLILITLQATYYAATMQTLNRKAPKQLTVMRMEQLLPLSWKFTQKDLLRTK